MIATCFKQITPTVPLAVEGIPDLQPRPCPSCVNGHGHARAVSTVAGRHVTRITLACDSCQHEWTEERICFRSVYLTASVHPSQTRSPASSSPTKSSTACYPLPS